MFEKQYKDTFDQVVASPDTVREVLTLKNTQKHKRIIPMLAVAVLLVCALATSVFAYAGYVVYENPGQMLEAFFGTNSHERGEGEIIKDNAGTLYVTPSFEREKLNEDAAEEYVAPYVFEVGQSITYNGNTLTVDAASYNADTQCGLVYMRLENPDGVPGYYLQTTGEVTWEGRDAIRASHMTADFVLVEEDTTDTCMTLACYLYKSDYWQDATLILRLLDCEDTLTIPMDAAPDMDCITLGNGGIQLSPISIVVHGDKLDLLNGGWETLVDTVVIRYDDGSEYLVVDKSEEIPVINCANAYMEPGDGYETDRNCVTYLLNRIVPLDEVREVIIDGVAYSVD